MTKNASKLTMNYAVMANSFAKVVRMANNSPKDDAKFWLNVCQKRVEQQGPQMEEDKVELEGQSWAAKNARNRPDPKVFVRTVKIVPNSTNVPRENGCQKIVPKALFSIQHWEFAIGQQMCPDVK